MLENVKRIAILGAGESGNGAALLAQQHGFDVFVSDFGLIKDNYRKELVDHKISFEEQRHTEELILNADLVIKSPGIPEKVAIIKKLRSIGKPIISEIEFAYQFKGESKIIAVTGSNGKSTTTSLVFHLLKNAGYDVSMAGNIGFSFAKQIVENHTQWFVLEISSFQLDDILAFKPDIALLLNITPDHLDRYDFKFEYYASSKFLITKNQTETDYLIINRDDINTTQNLHKHNIKARIISFSMDLQEHNKENGAFMDHNQITFKLDGEHLDLPFESVGLRGRHNQYNTMAAGISALAAGIRSDALRESFVPFEGLAHRMEYVATVRGVEFINDSKGTNLNSVWYALVSMNRPTILILGGQDKGNNYNEILELVKEKVKAIVCLGVDNVNIHKAFDDVVPKIIDTLSAEDAVKQAYNLADAGDCVLLSPGCASFDLFHNYQDRGQQFKNAVLSL